MTCNCEGLGRTAVMVHGMIQIEPCSCNIGDWEMVRKPQLQQILKEAEERAYAYNAGMEGMAGDSNGELHNVGTIQG
jgi:hypothetical protein